MVPNTGQFFFAHMFQLLSLHDIATHSWRIRSTSAYTGENLFDAFDWLLEDIRARLYYHHREDTKV